LPPPPRQRPLPPPPRYHHRSVASPCQLGTQNLAPVVRAPIIIIIIIVMVTTIINIFCLLAPAVLVPKFSTDALHVGEHCPSCRRSVYRSAWACIEILESQRQCVSVFDFSFLFLHHYCLHRSSRKPVSERSCIYYITSLQILDSQCQSVRAFTT
jgi:hypothetical protein